jgi:hypothetical protein
VQTHTSAPAPVQTHTIVPHADAVVHQPVRQVKRVDVTHRSTVHQAVEAVAADPRPVTHAAAPAKRPVTHAAAPAKRPATHAPASAKRPATHAPAATKLTATVKHAGGDRSTRPAASVSGGYVNPMAHASLSPERIDQGVDYSGSGTLGAIGAGTVTYAGTSNTGWPGAFVEYRLSNGPDAGRYVYYAESVVPAQGLHVGESVSAGQAIVTVTGGIEVGWGAGIGTETYAMKAGQWSTAMGSGNVATPSGKSFSALIASLGGPPGIVEG